MRLRVKDVLRFWTRLQGRYSMYILFAVGSVVFDGDLDNVLHPSCYLGIFRGKKKMFRIRIIFFEALENL